MRLLSTQVLRRRHQTLAKLSTTTEVPTTPPLTMKKKKPQSQAKWGGGGEGRVSFLGDRDMGRDRDSDTTFTVSAALTRLRTTRTPNAFGSRWVGVRIRIRIRGTHEDGERRVEDASATLALREDVARRLGAARTESALGVSRPGTAFSTLRERERETLPSSSTRRRLLTPREQREMQMGGTTHSTPGSTGLGGMPTIHSQETFYAEYEPSPTPASRTTTLDRSRTLGIPKPLPSLPSETSLSSGPTLCLKTRDRERELRKVSIASTSTVRGTTSTSTSTSTSAFPVTAPAAATTAVTPHTVSTQTPDHRTAFPSLPRTDSERSVRSSVTFSRPSTVSSVSALVDVRQQDTQRRRTASGGVGVVDPSASDPVRPTREREAGREAQHHHQQQQQQQSGSETERPKRRMQVGKMSLDANGKGTGTGNASDRSAVIAANAIVAAKVGISGGRGPPPVGVVKRDRDRRRTGGDGWAQE
ncbi:hypothetical protein C0995_010674 [Termitomyces sp. Mi166|nr:hypothetical protein C0995_010674 [Termitomyces sp. Mi166\